MAAAYIGSIAFFIVAILYVLLTLGFPVGEFAMGGKYQVMPSRMRITCGVSVLVQLFAILVLSQMGNIFSIGLPNGLGKVLCYVFAVYLLVNTVMNLLSKSRKEKVIMTPLSLIASICFWVVALS